MKQKTAMMDLIERLESEINKKEELLETISDSTYISGMFTGVLFAKQLLEKEKEQIMDAFYEGEDNIDENGKMIGKIDAEDYYSQTYLEESKQ